MRYQFINNWGDTIQQIVGTTDLTMTVTPGKAALLQSASATAPYVLTLQKASTLNNEIITDADIETVLCTGADPATGILTVVREQDGTTAQSWAVGDYIEARLPAMLMRQWLQTGGGVPMGAPLDMGENPIESYTESVAPAVVDDGSGNYIVDLSLGCSLYPVNLTSNGTMVIQNAPASGVFSFTLEITQDTTGGWTWAWPAGTTAPGGSAPTISSGASALDVYEVYTHDGGATYRVFTAGQGMA